jgi:hypothetical protein
MAELRDQLLKGLSEIRTLVLGAQILLGFQLQALFQPGFERLPERIKAFELGAFGLLVVVVAFLIAPTPRHRLVDHGEATRAQCAWVDRMLTLALPPFALAIGANVVLTTDATLGPAWALAAGALAAGGALFAWFGTQMMTRREKPRPPRGDDEGVPLKEKIDELLTESRIVLPGVQALLGFQFVAYLTDAFARLPAQVQAVHTASLFLLLVSMVLLMTPAPYHRLAERGENTARFERIGTGMVLWALPPMALGLACDLYVAVWTVTRDASLAGAAAAVTALASLGLWFGVPLRARMRGRRRAAGSAHGADHPERA